MAFVYHKSPIFCYQTFDRQSLQFTNHPVFPIYNPPPPDETPPQDKEAGGGEEPTDDPQEGEDAAAGDVGDPADG